jgi:hypothetical protein
MGLHDPFAQVQAQPSAGGLGSGKGLEDVLSRVGMNAAAAIVHRESNAPGNIAIAQPDNAALGHGFYGVDEQIHYNLSQLRGVYPHARGRAVISFYGDSGVFEPAGQ